MRALPGVVPALAALCAAAVASPGVAAAQQRLKHPGAMNSALELALVKAKVNKEENPWAAGWQKMMSDKASSLSYTPSPCAEITFDKCRNQLRTDGAAVYSHALQYVIKGNEENGKKAAEILNAWATKNRGIAPRSRGGSCLAATWGYHRMVAGAEILRSYYKGWSAAEVKAFGDYLRKYVYGPVSSCESDKSNWDAGGIANGLLMAVFLDDKGEFDRQAKRLIDFIKVYIYDPKGCNNESDRDQGHSRMGIGFLAEGAEVAWHQGVDAYAAHGNRIHAAFEHMAKYNLGQQVDQSGCKKPMKDGYRGNISPIMEVPYNHYRNRRKMAMPFTAATLRKGRPEGVDIHMLPWGTLTHPKTGLLRQSRPSRK